MRIFVAYKMIREMEKQFVPYELAVKLKELGFDEECFGWYHNTGQLSFRNNVMNQDLHETFVLAPLWQQAFDWFREKHSFDLCIVPMSFVGHTCYYKIEIHHPKFVWDTPPKVEHKNCNQARTICLEKLIELITNK